jgi:tRNA-specific adenosine deaminase 1
VIRLGGDASTRLLAALQDSAMAELKDATPWPVLAPGVPSRGRDDYSRLGVLRTKPGRADAPPVLSMACSDKIARWDVLGVQGALLSAVLARPLYIDSIIIGEVPEDLRVLVRGDCERAFWGRLGDVSGKHAVPGAYIALLVDKLIPRPPVALQGRAPDYLLHG